MDGRLAATGPVHWWWMAALFAMILVAKCVARSCTVGSGAAGGVLGPSLFIGGMTAIHAGVLEAQFPGLFPSRCPSVLIPVGMAGVLAAGMRTPLAAAVMVLEMTESYGLIVPLMLVCAIAYVVGNRWGLNQEQLPSEPIAGAHTPTRSCTCSKACA